MLTGNGNILLFPCPCRATRPPRKGAGNDQVAYLVVEINAALEVYLSGRTGQQYNRTAYILGDDGAELRHHRKPMRTRNRAGILGQRRAADDSGKRTMKRNRPT